MTIDTILSIIQMILAVLLVTGVLLQSKTSGLSGAFGGDDSSGSFQTRRGLEKIIFETTIVVAISFALISFVIFVLS